MTTQLGVAGIVLAVESDCLHWAFEPETAYPGFCVQGAAPDLQVTVRCSLPKVLDWGTRIVSQSHSATQPDPELNLYCSQSGEWVLEVLTGGWLQEQLVFSRRIGLFNSDFTSGQVFLELTDVSVPTYPFPLRSPLDRALFAHWLPHHDGLLLHAGAVVHEGRALVFAGESGRGKSTMAGLWGVSGQGVVLGEESIALRRVGGQVWAYGTPWVGETGLASPMGAPVGGLFFLRHAAKNAIRLMNPTDAVTHFLPRSYLAPYDAVAAERGLAFLSYLIQSVPAAELAFRPDAGVVELLTEGRWADDGLA